MNADQRRAAVGVVLLLGVLWAALGVATVVLAYRTPIGMDGTGSTYLALVAAAGVVVVCCALAWVYGGVALVRRVAERSWTWRSVAAGLGVAAAASAALALPLGPALPVLGGLLFFQCVALMALVVLTRPVVPAPADPPSPPV